MISRRKFVGLLAVAPYVGNTVQASIAAPGAELLPPHTAVQGELGKYITQPKAPEAWAEFADALTRILAELDEDEFLIVETKNHHYYVQFAGEGGLGVRAECVSNGYLDSDKRLSEKACSKLLELGWNLPTYRPNGDADTHPPDGSPNYFLDIDAPVPHKSLAGLAVITLRDVFGARHPGELQYRAFASCGDNIRFPGLRIRRKR